MWKVVALYVIGVIFLKNHRLPIATRTYPLLTYTTVFRSDQSRLTEEQPDRRDRLPGCQWLPMEIEGPWLPDLEDRSLSRRAHCSLPPPGNSLRPGDRKSTRLNSSH